MDLRAKIYTPFILSPKTECDSPAYKTHAFEMDTLYEVCADLSELYDHKIEFWPHMIEAPSMYYYDRWELEYEFDAETMDRPRLIQARNLESDFIYDEARIPPMIYRYMSSMLEDLGRAMNAQGITRTFKTIEPLHEEQQRLPTMQISLAPKNNLVASMTRRVRFPTTLEEIDDEFRALSIEPLSERLKAIGYDPTSSKTKGDPA